MGTAERCEEISPGYAFFAYPWDWEAPRIAPRQGCEESSTPFQGAVPSLVMQPGVRKKRVPLANLPARLRRAQCPIYSC